MWKAYEKIDFPERLLPNFWKRVEKSSDCWLWTGRQRHDGYGQYSWYHEGAVRTTTPHRIAYSILVSDVPRDLQLDHLCRVKNCVNPAHLEPVTPRVNSLRSNSIPAINARREVCQRGHEFTGTAKDGSRFCRECANLSVRQMRHRRNEEAGRPNIPKPSDRTHCPRGHEYSGISKKGSRICHPCDAAKVARYRERKKAKATPAQQ